MQKHVCILNTFLQNTPPRSENYMNLPTRNSALLRIIPLLLIGCTGSVDNFDVDLKFVLDDGESIPFDCVETSLDATYEFDPDGPPEIRTLNMSFKGPETDAFQCNINVAIEGLCGTDMYYPTTATASIYDCPDIPDYMEAEHLLSGSTFLEGASVDGGAGDLSGQNIRT